MEDSLSELERYKAGYEQANDLCEELMAMTNDLQQQVDSLGTEMEQIRKSEAQKLANERTTLKKQFAKQLIEVKEQYQQEQQQLADTLRQQHQNELQRKEHEINQLQGQLKRLFEHYTGDSAPKQALNNEKPPDQLEPTHAIETNEKYIAAQNQVSQLEKELEMARKEIKNVESKLRLNISIKEALKVSTDNQIRELNQTVAELKAQVEAAKPANGFITTASDSERIEFSGEEKTKWEAQVAQLHRELAEVNDQNASLTQQVASLNATIRKNENQSGVEVQNAELSQLRENNEKLQENVSALTAQLQNAERECHTKDVKVKEKDSLIAELQQKVETLQSELEREQNLVQQLQARPTLSTGESNSHKKDNEDHSEVFELRMALQTHQGTINDLQNQCNSLRQEILEREEVHKREVQQLEQKIQQHEQTLQETMLTHSQKLQHYTASYDEIEGQLETLINQIKQCNGLTEEYARLQDQYEGTRSTLALTEKDLTAHKELLYQERKNLEVSKEISCDLQKHILELTQTLEEVQTQMQQVQAENETLRLELVRQKKAFEKEKNAIVFDLLQKQMEHEDNDDFSTDFGGMRTPQGSHSTNGSAHTDPPMRDEKKSLNRVKQKLIDELWQESWDMINTPPKSDTKSRFS